MTSIPSFSALMALVPLLAHLPIIAASPVLDDRSFLQNRATTQTPLSFQSVGDAGISAQMMFLGTDKKVYILDKVENNPVNVTGQYGTHPAWAVEYDIDSNTYRTMDVESNTFCACGGQMANGTWAVFGGNQPVTTGGVATTSTGAYDDTTGGTAIRMITPCSDESCEWIQGEQPLNQNDGDTGGWLQMTGRRWYPTVEPLADGSLIIIGGDQNGGYVNTAAQDNPTYEFFPPKGNGSAIDLQFLSDTLPINLYALTWLMPSGKLFMQANRSSILYDYETYETTTLPDMPYAARVYPASGASVMLPLTPANNYTATVLFCGGSANTEWGNDGGPGFNITAVQADDTCVRISPDDDNPTYEDDDYMFEGRSMGEFVYLADGTLWLGNGVNMGTAGYGPPYYSTGEGYGQAPVYEPAIYNPAAPKGSRFNRTGLSASANERMYHSTAILLPDSSVFISGSNPNADFTTEQWRSRTDTERWYPWYYNEPRPTYTGMPDTISYGGSSFDLTIAGLTDEATVNSTKVVLLRSGFHTHCVGFGQRYLELETSYTIDMASGNTTIHVSQLPGSPGPTLFTPGSALFFVVVNGVPSMGEFVTVGNGKIGTQPTTTNSPLPSSQVKAVQTNTTTTSAAGASSTGGSSSGASPVSPHALPALALGLIGAALSLLS